MGRMVGVVDVGSNTVRLLVVRDGRSVLTEREMLHLGADVELLGKISHSKLELAAKLVRRYAGDARAAGAEHLAVLIASPGRQAANGAELLDRLAAASGAPTRILTAAEEGRLAFRGALQVAAPPARRTVAVVDVGGGSAQVVVGTRRAGPAWSGSVDLGAQRLTSRALGGDPPGHRAIAAARAEVDRYLDGLAAPPPPKLALAVGGSARGVKRIVGDRLGERELGEALEVIAVTPAVELAERFRVRLERAQVLAAGCVILAGLQERLGVPLQVVRGGLREGAVLELAETFAIAA
jgi:exopolyphosphatase / guanosine-5'-triphosphate,3'-diphosphate pyrophosphatase